MKLLLNERDQWAEDYANLAYVSLEAPNEAQLGPKALELIRNGTLAANESGIREDETGNPVDPTLNAGKTVGDVVNAFAKQVDSSDTEVARLFTLLKSEGAVDGNTTLHALVQDFDPNIQTGFEDEEEEEPPKRPKHRYGADNYEVDEEEGGDSPPNPGDAYLPDPEGEDDPRYWVDRVEGAPGTDDSGNDIWTDTYKNCYGDEIGTMTYQIEADGSYWQKAEKRLCGEGEEYCDGELRKYRDWLVTTYYSKYDYNDNPNTVTFEYTNYAGLRNLSKTVEVHGRNDMEVRGAYREYYNDIFCQNVYTRESRIFDAISFYPNGRVWVYEKRSSDVSKQRAEYTFSPDGKLYTYFGEDAKGFYQYFVYPDQGILIGDFGSEFDGEYAFDPTGHSGDLLFWLYLQRAAG